MNRDELVKAVAAMTDTEFAQLEAEARQPSGLTGSEALARGREAFSKGGHHRLTTIDVEKAPATDYAIEG
ncbi:hypothetical protein ABQE93_24360 [Mycolicibacterium sp. XJ662]